MEQFCYADTERGHWLGSTDLVALAGLSHWRAPITVWEEKVRALDRLNHTSQREREHNEQREERILLELGTFVEPFIAEHYRQKTEFSVTRTSPLLHRNYAHWGCSPDFLVGPNETHSDNIAPRPVTHGLETKLVIFGGQRANELDTWGEDETDQIPQDYLVQVQWCMNVTELHRWDVAALWYCTRIRYFTVQRNAALIAQLREIADDFWINHVLTEKPPTPDGSQDYSRYLARTLPRREQPAVYDLEHDPAYDHNEQLRDEDKALLLQVVMNSQVADAAAKQKALGWQQFALRFGGHARVRGEGFQVSSRLQTRRVTDWRGIAMWLAAELGQSVPAELVSSHTQETPPFLVPSIARLPTG